MIASDSFKGSLSSSSVADAAEKGIRRVLPECGILKFSVSDGGEGLVDTLVGALDGRLETAVVSDPLGRKIKAEYGICYETAIIEMAAASGLTLLSSEERNPMNTSSYGTGELIKDALSKGCRKFLIGIGGSASCDGGTGALEALGWKFLDKDGWPVRTCGKNLRDIVSIDDGEAIPELDQSSFSVACDVDNPFCGPRGASFVFSPQKGASPQEVEALDLGLRNLADVIFDRSGIDIREIAGSGAAGGLGGALKFFLGAELFKGIDMVLDALHFDDALRDADLVITGEGKIDNQTLSGKAVSGVLERCKKFGVPCVALCGTLEMCDELRSAGFDGIFPVWSGQGKIEAAMEETVAFENVSRTAAEVISMKIL